MRAVRTRQPPYLTGCHNTSLEIDMYAWVSMVFIGGLFGEDLSGSRTEGVEIVYSASCLNVETNIGEQNLTKSNK